MSSSSSYEAKMTMLFFVLILTGIGLIAVSKYHQLTRIIDDQRIVIDEVIGQLLTFTIAYDGLGKFASYLFNLDDSKSSFKLLVIIFLCGFIPFRFCDITKPFYISRVDRGMKNSVGVILDDILAGILAALPFLLLH
jgi:phosphatidylglycerophosphatase A